jgi:hypothetical protein
MHFLDLFQPEYQAQSLSLGERIIMALFLHEIILTTKTSTLILTTKLISFSYKSCEETRNFMVIDLILAEVLKTFQQNGNLVFLVSLTSILVKDNFTGHDFAAKLQTGLERLIHKINEFSFTGLEFLAAWFSHLRSNIEISFNWLKEAKKVEKGKFLISKIIRNLMQISQYSKLNEIPHLADFVDFFPAEPKPIFLLQDPNHQRHADFLMMIDKFNAKTPGEEMNQFLSSNELVNSYGPDLQDLFVQVLLFKSRYIAV